MTRRDQKGMASILIVGILVILLTLISLGFAKLMNRSVNSFVNQQLDSSASYAAQTGVNDVLDVIKGHIKAGDPDSSFRSDTCDGLFDQLDPVINSDSQTSYTCALVNPTPDSLIYQQLPPDRAQVIKITADAQIGQLMISWQSSDRTKTNFSSTSCTQFTDERTWNSNNCAPVLRLTLYPVPLSGDLGNNTDATSSQASSRTVFLTPNNSALPVVTPYPADGSTINAACGSHDPPQAFGTFGQTRDEDCAVVFSGLSALPNYDHFYAVITPIYGQADVKIKANNSLGTFLNFQKVQALVDVTGQSAGVSKRLQARANISRGATVDAVDSIVPDDAIRSAGTLCKRINVGTDISSTDINTCGLDIQSPGLSCSGPTNPDIGSTPSFGASGGHIPYASWSITGGTGTISGSGSSISVNLNVPDSNSNSPQPKNVTVTDNSGDQAPCIFSVKPVAPSQPTISGPSPIGQTSATLHGSVDPNGTSTTLCQFQYGTTLAYGGVGNCGFSTNSFTPVPVNVAIGGLASNTTYHFRLCVRNATGSTICSPDSTFATLRPPPGFCSGGATNNGSTATGINGFCPNGGGSWSYNYTVTGPCGPDSGSGSGNFFNGDGSRGTWTVTFHFGNSYDFTVNPVTSWTVNTGFC